MKLVSFAVILSCCIALLHAIPVGTDPKTIYNTVEGSDDAEIVPELVGKNTGLTSNDGPVTVNSSNSHTSVTFFGTGISFRNGKIFLNGKEVDIEKKTDYIQCDNLKCPPEAIKCAIRQVKNPENSNETITTRRCGDKDNKIIQEDKQMDPLPAEDQKCPVNSYIEMSFGDEFLTTSILDPEIAKEIEEAQAHFNNVFKSISESFRKLWDDPFASIKNWF